MREEATTCERAIIDKIRLADSSLSDWTNVEVHYGIGDRYGNAFVIDGVSEDAKYICAALNSSLARWFTRHASKPIEKMRVPKVCDADRRRVTRLVDEILEIKGADCDADTSYLDWQIDYVVHEIYGLTDDETTVIYRNLGLVHQTDEEEDAALVRALEADRSGERVSEEEVMATLRGFDDSSEPGSDTPDGRGRRRGFGSSDGSGAKWRTRRGGRRGRNRGNPARI